MNEARSAIDLDRIRKLRIGWATGGLSLDHPAHRRTLLYYAKIRGLHIEIANINSSYEVVYVSQGADITQWARYDKGRILYDCSDAYLAESFQRSFRVVFRGLAKFVTKQHRYLRLSHVKAIQDMLRRADAVFCGTEEQRALVEPFNKNIHFLIGFHQNDIRSIKHSFASGEQFNLVWEGLPSLLGFKAIMPALRRLKERRKIAIHLITDIKRGRYLNDFLPVHTKKMIDRLFSSGGAYLYEWNTQMFSTIVTACDLAIIPIPMDLPFWVGKPANKLLLFWRMGIPTLTSATPAYAKAMSECGLDMTCASLEEWQQKLEYYIDNETARKDAGQRARDFVEAEYSEEKLLARWDAAFASVLE